ncbi:hypothetical protein SS50377_27676 [Spironucleus salmonicida]|uniref:Uncharacterized protein n=1 Tax=Spironucleus salmonicida TaxID=348837 RepID=V6LQM3_9EUKA|nr:hypothetical protein SS50377_27676 [Spironucleus salmonicida]|eukprot:EST46548.1 Hypothetical protein SS50377_13352 [Spironucleus salmonicida]
MSIQIKVINQYLMTKPFPLDNAKTNIYQLLMILNNLYQQFDYDYIFQGFLLSVCPEDTNIISIGFQINEVNMIFALQRILPKQELVLKFKLHYNKRVQQQDSELLYSTSNSLNSADFMDQTQEYLELDRVLENMLTNDLFEELYEFDDLVFDSFLSYFDFEY